MTWITFSDMRQAKFCARGTRKMFERYGIDIDKVIRERGISAEELKQKTGEHAMVDRVIEIAEERERHG
jgi:ribosome-binding protein aMBF1 (putative translation factor)